MNTLAFTVIVRVKDEDTDPQDVADELFRRLSNDIDESPSIVQGDLIDGVESVESVDG